MSKSFRNIGIALAGTCGVLSAYATLRPALEEQKLQRLGHEVTGNQAYKTTISAQMREDFKEAGEQFENRGGFAWGIRQMLFGRNPYVEVKTGGDGAGASKERVTAAQAVEECREGGQKG